MSENPGHRQHPSGRRTSCSNAPRKSLSLTHSVPQMPQSKECHSGKLSKSIVFAAATSWRGHCCGGGVVSQKLTRMMGGERQVARARARALWAMVVLALVTSAAACSGGPAAQPRLADAPGSEGATLYPTLQENPAPAAVPYVLQVGDELAIKFYTNPELNEDVKIRPDGMISLQLIDDVQAAGRSPADLDAELSRRYTGELADPQISVIVRTAAGHRMYVDGEVNKPGVVDVVGGMTLYQAIQVAGGLLDTAHRKQIILIRKGPDGQSVGRSIDVRGIQRGSRPGDDIPVRPLDIVYVPKSKIATVDLFVKQYIRDALPISTLPIPAF